ncbi:MAG TPA: hypothetical protein VD971_12515 [Phycisphaerales bacterium]|nr:hypothetical protein [Phycisphaerales bacterium]
MPSTPARRSPARTLIAAACLGSPALADDLAPPSWRGGLGTTVQHWDFSSGPSGAAPDALPLSNPYGSPQLIATNLSNWLASLGGRNDVWAVNDFDFLTFRTPNANVPLPTEVWIQVTYQSFSNTIGTQLYDNLGNLYGPDTGYPIVTPLPNGWFHKLEVYTLPTAPPFEDLRVLPPTPGTVVFVDQVVIDSRVVPAPTTAALALAAACLCPRRRSR